MKKLKNSHKQFTSSLCMFLFFSTKTVDFFSWQNKATQSSALQQTLRSSFTLCWNLLLHGSASWKYVTNWTQTVLNIENKQMKQTSQTLLIHCKTTLTTEHIVLQFLAHGWNRFKTRQKLFTTSKHWQQTDEPQRTTSRTVQQLFGFCNFLHVSFIATKFFLMEKSILPNRQVYNNFTKFHEHCSNNVYIHHSSVMLYCYSKCEYSAECGPYTGIHRLFELCWILHFRMFMSVFLDTASSTLFTLSCNLVFTEERSWKNVTNCWQPVNIDNKQVKHRERHWEHWSVKSDEPWVQWSTVYCVHNVVLLQLTDNHHQLGRYQHRHHHWQLNWQLQLNHAHCPWWSLAGFVACTPGHVLCNKTSHTCLLTCSPSANRSNSL